MKLGVSSCGAPLTPDFFARCKSAGIDGIEISVGKKAADELDFALTRRLADEYKIELCSFHLPFSPFNEIDISSPELADQTVKYLSSLIKKATEIGIKTFVIHASGEPIAEEARTLRMDCAKNSLFALAEYAERFEAVIAVEDLPRTCLGRDSSDILELISAHPSLRVCFDTNHLLKEDISVFIANVGKSIVTTHISDYDAINERHWLPGEGIIDWSMLRAALDGVGYNGYWLYELGLDGSTKTIDRERCLAHEDFKRNYDEIMANRPLSAIGKRKPDLPMWP